ncbi:hypothetical protein E2C01_048709 [Portunus trituberculatus]|uniref:Uncharacterized protein n=1 Tax=Portunus trituberculatus TaxID=210409 RepID=A0A5B7GBU9_PORTR|nr:hypothetical protein [Portunus trituberculatus]
MPAELFQVNTCRQVYLSSILGFSRCLSSSFWLPTVPASHLVKEWQQILGGTSRLRKVEYDIRVMD